MPDTKKQSQNWILGRRYVSGHDFSRAVRHNKEPALAAEALFLFSQPSMTHPDADIIATVRLYRTVEGGRQGPLPVADVFRCIFTIQGENFDCGLLLENRKTPLGETIRVPIVFVYPHYVRPMIKVGDTFTLRELRIIAEGRVEEILPERPRRV